MYIYMRVPWAQSAGANRVRNSWSRGSSKSAHLKDPEKALQKWCPKGRGEESEN